MKTRKSQLTLAASALAMAVALAGCGSGGTALNGGSSGAGSSTHAASLAQDRATQRAAVNDAIATAHSAVSALTNDATPEQIAAAEAAIKAVQDAIDAADDIRSHEVAGYEVTAANIESILDARKQGVMAQDEVNKLTADLMAAEGMQMLDDTPEDDTEAQKQLRAAMARYMAAEGMQTLPEDASMDTEAQKQLRAAMARYMAAEGMQTLPEDASMDTEAQKQLRAAMARYMAAEGMQTLPEDASMDTEAQKQLRAAMARYTAAEGMQTLPEDASMDTPAQKQLRDAMARYMAAEGMQTLPEDASMDTPAQKQLRDAMARYMAAEGMQTLPEDASMDTPAQKQLRDAMARYTAAEGMQTLPEDASMDTPAQKQLRDAMARYMAAEGMQDIAAIMDMDEDKRTEAQKQLLAVYNDLQDAKGALEDAENGRRQAELQLASADNVVGLFVDASKSRNAADQAAKDADTAKDNAEKYSVDSMLTALGTGVKGSSATARMNAQMVLDAKADADMAVTAAKQALDDAEAALMEAKALPEDVEGRDDLIAALEDAVMAAEDKIEAVEMIADGDPLKDAVAKVTGPGPEDLDDADDIGNRVGEAVLGAFGTSTADDRITPGNTAPTADADREMGTEANDADDAGAMNWSMIAGEGNLMEMRIVDTGTKTKAVMAKSVGGMTLTNSTLTAGDDVSDGTQTNVGDATYNGIVGTVFCAGSDCKVEGVTDNLDTDANENETMRKLVGSWYFAPDSEDALWVKASGEEASGYELAKLYAKYGYWLSGTGDTDVTINTYAMAGAGDDTPTEYDTKDPAGCTDCEATYKGEALGMSVHQVFDTNGKVEATHSGEFTADVTLEAKFGDTPTLSGTVSNFMGGAHVDNDWMVTLKGTGTGTAGDTVEFPAGGSPIAGGVTVGNDDDRTGDWTARAYGNDAEERAVGIYGTFDAHFTDGHVAGGYATRIVE